MSPLMTFRLNGDDSELGGRETCHHIESHTTISCENLGPGGPISKIQIFMLTNSSEIKTVRKEKNYGNCIYNRTLL